MILFYWDQLKLFLQVFSSFLFMINSLCFIIGFTVWDKITIKGPMTVQGFMDEIAKTYKITISIISAGKVSLYNKYSNDPKMKERFIF